MEWQDYVKLRRNQSSLSHRNLRISIGIYNVRPHAEDTSWRPVRGYHDSTTVDHAKQRHKRNMQDTQVVCCKDVGMLQYCGRSSMGLKPAACVQPILVTARHTTGGRTSQPAYGARRSKKNPSMPTKHSYFIGLSSSTLQELSNGTIGVLTMQ